MSVPYSIKYTTDFDIQDIILVTAAGVYDVYNHMIELSYFENLFSPVISGNLVLSDAAGIINISSLSGNDFIKIKFQKQNNEDTQTEPLSIDRSFRVYSVTKRTIDPGNNFETYNIEFCSEELLLSEKYRISKSYKKTKISDIIADIMKTYLKVGAGQKGTKSFFYESTTGVYDFVLPNKKIFETINWLTNYAMPSTNNIGADMLFYENSNGFNLSSLQSLFAKSSVATFTYNPKNISTGSDPYLEEEQFEIMKLEILKSFDTLDAVSNGSFSNRVLTINPITRTKQVTDFNYNDYQKKATMLNKGVVTNNYQNRFGESLYDAPANDKDSGVLRLCVSNSNTQNNKQIKSTPGSVQNDFFIEKTLHNRVAQISIANYNRLRITVPGFNHLSVGMCVDLAVVMTTTGKRESDPFLSGKYLVSAIRHIINPGKYLSVIEVIKDSNVYGLAQISSTDNNFKMLSDGVQ